MDTGRHLAGATHIRLANPLYKSSCFFNVCLEHPVFRDLQTCELPPLPPLLFQFYDHPPPRLTLTLSFTHTKCYRAHKPVMGSKMHFSVCVCVCVCAIMQEGEEGGGVSEWVFKKPARASGQEKKRGIECRLEKGKNTL